MFILQQVLNKRINLAKLFLKITLKFVIEYDIIKIQNPYFVCIKGLFITNNLKMGTNLFLWLACPPYFIYGCRGNEKQEGRYPPALAGYKYAL